MGYLHISIPGICGWYPISSTANEATMPQPKRKRKRTNERIRWSYGAAKICMYMHIRACSLRNRAQTESMNGVKINILCTNKKPKIYKKKQKDEQKNSLVILKLKKKRGKGRKTWCQQPAAVLIYTKRSQACNASRAGTREKCEERSRVGL